MNMCESREKNVRLRASAKSSLEFSPVCYCVLQDFMEPACVFKVTKRQKLAPIESSELNISVTCKGALLFSAAVSLIHVCLRSAVALISHLCYPNVCGCIQGNTLLEKLLKLINGKG